MNITPNIDPHIVGKLEDSQRLGIKLTLEGGTIRLHSPETGHILHSDLLEDVSLIESFVAEGFRKFVLISMLSEEDVPPDGDYSEARWNQEGLDFYGHSEGSIPHGSFCYSVSVGRSGLNWTEIWNWPTWPRSVDVRNFYEQLKVNYQATVRLLAFLAAHRMGAHFNAQNNSVQIGNLRVKASNGTWQTHFALNTSAPTKGVLPALNALNRFIDLDPKRDLLAKSEPEPMISDIDLA